MQTGKKIILLLCLVFSVTLTGKPAFAMVSENEALLENWDGIRYRRWVGRNLWANRLEDWEVRGGYLMPVNADPYYPLRTVHVITREVLREKGDFSLSVKISSETPILSGSSVGFLVGAGAGLLDWRAATLVHSASGKGGGVLAWLELGSKMRLSFRDNNQEYKKGSEFNELAGALVEGEIVFGREAELLLTLEVKPGIEKESYNLRLVLTDAATKKRLAQVVLPDRPEREILGSFALAFNQGEPTSRQTLRFRDLRAWGDKLAQHPERAFGPIIGTLYSVAGGVLKMTAQFAPVAFQGDRDEYLCEPLKARLEVASGESLSGWAAVDSAVITTPGYIASFRVEDWQSSTEKVFRVAYNGQDGETYYYRGTIAREPEAGEVFSLAAFTGMGLMGRPPLSGRKPPGEKPVVGLWTPANIWFPFAESVNSLDRESVDLLCFTGDQIYEHKPYNAEFSEKFPVLDYLYKWYLWYWSFGQLTRHRPAVCQVDDHDVYQGNIWGWSGRLMMTGKNWDGGYQRSPLFVQLVERTQCSHNPDPYDPTPILNGIGVYYTGFTYGGVSFALLEDRKFKSPSSITDESATLLGQRQLEFLEHWATDWHGGATMKVVLSQGTYAAVQTDAKGKLFRNTDSGGFPKHGRDRALRAFRKARAMIVCGDQHLATLVKMGIESPADAAVQFCVPALGNIFWRWFYPGQPGSGPLADPKGYTGDFEDGLGNHFRMIATANPTDVEFMGTRNFT
ncbi:MAG: alkaline phosphatase D family protein, partial [Gemmatimonadota bacterium]|nr:alkaline phosphatase D family protein [Gemmatimonadota bacterium]